MKEIRKQIEEAIEEESERFNKCVSHFFNSKEAYEEGLEKGANIVISKVEEANRWRKVSEEPMPIMEPLILRLKGLLTLFTLENDELAEYAKDKWKDGEWKPIN